MENNKRRDTLELISVRERLFLSLSLSICTTTGWFLDHDMPFATFTYYRLVGYFLACALVTGVVFALITMFYVAVCNVVYRRPLCHTTPARVVGGGKEWLLSFVLIMFFWGIVWYTYCPGLWNYDPDQVWQFVFGKYTKHHPLIHTLLMGSVFVLGDRSGNHMVSVVLYDAIQMSFMASVFALCKVHIRQMGYPRLAWGSLFFFALCPLHSILSISTTKDVIYSGLFLLACLMSIKLSQSERNKRRQMVLLCVILVLTMLFRNGTVYVMLVVMAFELTRFLYCRGKEKRCLNRWGFCVLTIILYCLTDQVLTTILHAEGGSIGEALSVPCQQIGRIAMYDNDPEAERVFRYYYTENARYVPAISDPMKSCFIHMERGKDVAGLIAACGELFVKHPLISIDSFLYLTKGDWYIYDESHAEIYGTIPEERQGILLTDIKEGFGIRHITTLPQIETLYEKAFTENSYQRIPVLRLMFAPATYFWIIVLCACVILKSECWYRKVILIALLAQYALLMLFAPCVLIRYIYPLIVSTPLVIALLFKCIEEMLREKR